MMSPQERLRALLRGEPIDRVPFFLMGRGFCSECVGYEIAEMYNDPEKSFLAQQRTSEMYGIEDMPRFIYAGLAMEFGGEIEYPRGNYSQAPTVTRYPVNSEQDVLNLELPDINDTRFLPLMMTFSQIAERHHMPIIVHAGSPLTGAAQLCETELLMRWMGKKPEIVHELLRLITDYFLEVVKYWIETFGPEDLIVLNASPVESNQLISPRFFEEFAFPYIMELHQKTLAAGVRHFYCHICGEQNLNLPYWAEVPMGERSIISVGHEMDIENIIQNFGENCIVAGNVDPSVIQWGTTEQIYELTRQCIEKGKNAPGGYMLMPGCELPPKAYPYNVYMMKKAIDRFGSYE